MKKHLLILLIVIGVFAYLVNDAVVLSAHPCAQDIRMYDTCRDAWFSEQFCVVKSASNKAIATSCMEQTIQIATNSSTSARSRIESHFEQAESWTAPLRKNTVTIALSPTKTARKTIIHDLHPQDSQEWYKSLLQVTATLWWNQQRLFWLYSVPSYEKEVAEYMIDALDAYDVSLVDNWSSYFASLDPSVNPNVFDVVMNDEQDLADFVEDMKALDTEVKIYPVYIPILYELPNDAQQNSLRYLKWGNGVNAYEAWDQLSGTVLWAVQVGIVDDGFYVQHEDLSIASASPAGAWGGHGTHVAWLVGALTNNNKWVASAARNMGNIQIRGYNYNFDSPPWYPDNDHDGSYNIMWLVQQAVQDGAKIINMSRWGWPYNAQEQSIFTAAHNQWVILIAAAWNEYASQPSYPARYQHVISVWASNSNGSKASFSNAGADILSPGVSILSTCIGWGYCSHDGTSMASPLAASVAALLLSIDPSLWPDEVLSLLQSTTNNKGVINACNAVAELLDNGYTCSGSSQWWTTAWTTNAWSTVAGSTNAWTTTAWSPWWWGICDDPPSWQTLLLPQRTTPSQVSPIPASVPAWTRVLEWWVQWITPQPVQVGWRFLTMSVWSAVAWSTVHTLSETPRSQVSTDLLLCNNGKKDPSESDIDCGWTCGPCSYGDVCLVAADCTTHYCVSYSWWTIGTWVWWTWVNTDMYETVRFEVTVSPNVLYPLQQANVVIKALNKMHQVNMRAVNAYTVRLEGPLWWTIYIPASGSFTLSDYGVKFYEPWFAAQQPWPYTLFVQDIHNSSIRGSMPITILWWIGGGGGWTTWWTTWWSTSSGWWTSAGTTTAWGGGGQQWCMSDADCKSTEYCKKTIWTTQEDTYWGGRFLTMSVTHDLPTENATPQKINTWVVYIKYKDNGKVFFSDFDSASTSPKEYVTTLQQNHVSTVREVRSRAISLATYRDFSHLRALTTLQQIFEKYPVYKLERPLAWYTTSYDRATNLYMLRTEVWEIDEIVSTLEQNPSVEYVESGEIEVVPYAIQINDPKINQQRHVRWKETYAGGINVVEARNIAQNTPRTGWTIYVVVADSGVDSTHPDITWKVVWYSPAGDHGTHVWGLIGAIANNSEGVVWVAWIEDSVKLVHSSLCDIPSAAAKLAWKKWLVNLSCGIWPWSSWPQSYKDAADAIIAQWNVLVAAAGNGWAGEWPGRGYADANKNVPCNYSPVFCIGATSSSNSAANFSSYGSLVDVSSPWLNIYSTCVWDGYCTKSGTSMATPVAAWSVAFLMSLGASGAQAVQLLKETSVAFNNAGRALWVWRIDLCNATAKYLWLPASACTNSFVPSPWSGGTSWNWSTSAWSTSAGNTGWWSWGLGQCVPKNGGTTIGWWTTAWWTTAWNSSNGSTDAGSTDAGSTDGGDYDQCADGYQNWQETDIDCWGPYCPQCIKGQMCDDNTDCVTNYCNTWTGDNNWWIGSGAYECPTLSGATLWTKNISFTDASTLSDVFSTTNEYVLIDIGATRCSACRSKAAEINGSTTLKNLLWPNSNCWFASIVAANDLTNWKNSVWWFVAQHSKWFTNFSTNGWIGAALWINNLSTIPRIALLRRNGTYVSDNFSTSNLAQYCTMCPMVEHCTDAVDNDGDGSIDCDDADCEEDPACVSGWVTGEELCGDDVDNDGDGFIDAAYSVIDYNDSSTITAADIVLLNKVIQWIDQPLSGKVYDINADGSTNAQDAQVLQQYILGVTTGIEVCSDGVDNDCNGQIDSVDEKCSPPEEWSICEELKIFDCNGDGVFSELDKTFLQQWILWVLSLPLLPTCDANGSATHSTLDIVLMQWLLLWNTNTIAQMKLFDYTADNIFNQLDVDQLWVIILGNGTCPVWKVCDINKNGAITLFDQTLLQQMLAVVPVFSACGQGNNEPLPEQVYCDVDKDLFFWTTPISTDEHIFPHVTPDGNGTYNYCTNQQCLVNISCEEGEGNDCNDADNSIHEPWTACVTMEWDTGTLNASCVCEWVAWWPEAEICTNMLDDDDDWFVSCLDEDCIDDPVCDLIPMGWVASCWSISVLDCNGDSTFSYDDIEALRKSILWVIWPISLPTCDINASFSHSTLDIVLMTQVLQWSASMSALKLFDYTQDGTYTVADKQYLREVYYGIEQCPSGKVCDIDGQWGVTREDISILSRLENNQLTVCNIWCGNGITDTWETCDDGNSIAGDGCSVTCQLEPVPPPQEDPMPQEPAPTSYLQRIFAFVSWLFTDTVSTTRKMYASLFDEQQESPEPVFMTASLRDRTFVRLCNNGTCDAEQGESPLSCPADCGCGNGLLNPRREQCDDGNTKDGDGCSAGCMKEWSGMMCAYYPGVLPPANDDTIVSPPPPSAGDSCEAMITVCLQDICSQYPDDSALCYQKCCQNFSTCASIVPMCARWRE